MKKILKTGFYEKILKIPHYGWCDTLAHAPIDVDTFDTSLDSGNGDTHLLFCELLNEPVDESDPDLDEPEVDHLLHTAETIRKDYPVEDSLDLRWCNIFISTSYTSISRSDLMFK
ncbi:inositol oxygenase 4 [Artemisia annua]|uniref:Inositol oxygenase n=1 Tax=Artemisia annua TaxID=35608 RepID=A0A2U1N467_ARTAN|nr:inositol oxygenase 4 [Artemisia annua]